MCACARHRQNECSVSIEDNTVSPSTVSSASQCAASYPRPQLRRPAWLCLNGKWKFLLDPDLDIEKTPEPSDWNAVIEVPFCPESKRSGIGDTSYHRRCWYQRDFEWQRSAGARTLLHFGAVDYVCRVWVNGHFVGVHEGGFSSFHFDVTPFLDGEAGRQTVTVCADDDPHDLGKPRGKQDWQLDPHAIWYPRTTGIWQTVWVEEVPEIYIDRIGWEPHLERWEIAFAIFLSGSRSSAGTLEVKLSLSCRNQLLASDTYRVMQGEVHRQIALSDPGVDDFRNELLWSPERPTLLNADIELWRDGQCVDKVTSYTALRSIAVRKDRFMLNGRPYYLRMVLDQGYWPDSLMTAPGPDAHRKDVELAKQMGFNGVRKHQKIEDPNYLYWADVLGLLVWEEMPSAYRFTHDGVKRIVREWVEIIDRDRNHPCIAVWVSFNESWGVPDLAEKRTHQSCVQALYYLTRTLDSTRLVIGNDGWESIATDIIGIHDYDENPERLLERWASHLEPADLLNRRQPAGRLLTIDGYPHEGQPIMLTEFGGIAYAKADASPFKPWGYSMTRSEAELQKKYSALLAAVQRLDVFSGFCYTQFSDTFQEANGLLYADRTPKFPIDVIFAATRGQGVASEDFVTVAMGAPPRRSA
jgi:hypothetical protein